MTPQPLRFRRRDDHIGTCEAMQFTTNNEVGSPTMDAIVNWANQGQPVCFAWHNGTNIFWYGQRASVGDWCVKFDNRSGTVWPSSAHPQPKVVPFEDVYYVEAP